MNIQVTNPDKYSNVIRVWNYGARLVVDKDTVDGHLSIIFSQDGKEWAAVLMGAISNESLDEDYGFRFVSHENNIDNRKYYF